MTAVSVLHSQLIAPITRSVFWNKPLGIALVIVVGIFLPIMGAHADWQRTNYFTTSDLKRNFLFPDSIAANENLIIAGDPYINDNGAVYVFDAETGIDIGKLVASDGAENDFFGSSVAINGDTIVVGAPGDDDNGEYSGSAYVYDATTGNQIHKLTASDGLTDDTFGHSVAVSGNLVVVGAYFHNSDVSTLGFTSGAVYVFDLTTGNQIYKLTGSESAWFFGYSVAVNNDRVVVGSLEAGGVVYVFDTTTGQLNFTLSPFTGSDGDHFGWSLDQTNNHIVIGAPRPGFGDDDVNAFGSVFVYDGVTGTEIHKFIPTDGVEWGSFGGDVAISGNTIVIGSGTGSAYIYDAVTGTEIQKLPDLDGYPPFTGEPVAISGNRIVLGHSFTNSVYVYQNVLDSEQVIDFENTTPGNYPAISIDDYKLSPTWNNHIKIYDDGLTTSIAAAWNDSLQLERSDGQSFNLQSFDYRGRWSGVSSYVEITGTLSDGSIVHVEVNYDASEWKTKTLNWNDLIHVAFYTPDGRLQIDNFIFDETTQPGTILDFENTTVGDFASVSESNYELMPLNRNTVSVYSDNDNQSITPYWNDTLRLTRQDGESFNLNRFDYSNRWSTNTVGTMTVVGLRADGSELIDSLVFSSIYWHKRTLNWTNLIQVDFISTDGRMMLDKMELSE